MRRFIALLLAVILTVSLCACKKAPSSEPQSSVPIEESKPAPEESEPAPVESKPAPEESEPEPEEESGPPVVLDGRGSTEGIAEKIISFYEAPDYIEKTYADCIDNETPLEELLKGTETVSASDTYLLSTGFFVDLSYMRSEPVDKFEAITGVPITFARDTGVVVYDEWRDSNASLMYTVFKTKLGGNLFLWYYYYPDLSTTTIRSTVYVDGKDRSFENINVGDSIEVLKDYSPKVELVLKNFSKYQGGDILYLNKDKLTYITFDKNKNIDEIKEYPDFIMPSPIWGRGDEPEDLTIPFRTYNFTILPQDYPPAS